MPVMSERRQRAALVRGKADVAKQPDAAASSTPSSPPPGKPDLKSKTGRLSGEKESVRSSTDKPAAATPEAKTSSTARTGSRQTTQDARQARRQPSSDSSSSSNSSPEVQISGRIKNLAGFWTAPKDEVARKKRLEVAERSDKVKDDEDDGDDDESDDELNGLMRTQENVGEKETPIEIEKGMTKSIASMWQNRKEPPAPVKKAPFILDIETEGPAVFENEPVVLEGVIRSDDRSKREDIVSRPGRIKDLAESFTAISKAKKDEVVSKPGSLRDRAEGYATRSKADSSDEEVSTEKASDEVIERGKIRNVRERWKKRQEKSTSGAAAASESDSDGDNTPTEDSHRSSRAGAKDQVIEQAKTKNLRDRFVRMNEPEVDSAKKASKAASVGHLHAIVAAKEYGVFENEPIVRDDVVRADDDQPDVISFGKTKKLRKMWTMMEKEKTKKKEAKHTEAPPAIVEKAKKKQEPEPEVAQSPATKSKRGTSGQLQGHAAESSKRRDDRKAARAARVQETEAKDGQTTEGKGKLPKIQSMTVTSESPESKTSTPKSPSLVRYASKKKF